MVADPFHPDLPGLSLSLSFISRLSGLLLVLQYLNPKCRNSAIDPAFDFFTFHFSLFLLNIEFCVFGISFDEFTARFHVVTHKG